MKFVHQVLAIDVQEKLKKMLVAGAAFSKNRKYSGIKNYCNSNRRRDFYHIKSPLSTPC